MKASIKFGQDQKPIFRAKVPLSIWGFSFQSGISAADAQELCLSFATVFDSGPSVKVSYRPNDSFNPFALCVRTGIGQFGSPIDAPMTLSAEFNLLGNGNPSFFLHFRPQIGDFSVRKFVGSQINSRSQPSALLRKNKAPTNGDEVVDGVEPPTADGLFAGEGENGFPDPKNIGKLLSGVEVSARTILPLRDRAAMKLRWGVRLPAEIPFSKVPCLVLSKIGVEHVPAKQRISDEADVADTCSSMKRELEALQAESRSLWKSMEELRSQIGVEKSSPVAPDARDSGKKSKAERSGHDGIGRK